MFIHYFPFVISVLRLVTIHLWRIPCVNTELKIEHWTWNAPLAERVPIGFYNEKNGTSSEIVGLITHAKIPLKFRSIEGFLLANKIRTNSGFLWSAVIEIFTKGLAWISILVNIVVNEWLIVIHYLFPTYFEWDGDDVNDGIRKYYLVKLTREWSKMRIRSWMVLLIVQWRTSTEVAKLELIVLIMLLTTVCKKIFYLGYWW